MHRTHSLIQSHLLLIVLLFSTPASSQETSVCSEQQPETGTSALCNRAQEFLLETHAEAIRYGRQEYIAHVLLEEKFVSGRFSTKTDAWKTETAGDYFDNMLDSFIGGRDNGSLDRFVARSPAFTQYLLSFPEDFALVSELQVAYHIAEQDAIQTEEDAKQAALRRLIETLDSN